MNFKSLFNKKCFSDKLFLFLIFVVIAIFIHYSFKLNWFLFIALSAIFLYMTIIFIFTYFLYPKIAKTKKLPLKLPKVAAVTYAFNNWTAVKYTVEKLKKLKYPKKVPIYVITDGTCKFLDSDKDVIQIILPKKYFTKNQINVKATIMNIGLKKIKTDYLFCVDGDTLPNDDALINMVGFMTKNVAVVNGVLLPSNNKTFLEKLQTIEYNFSWGISLRVLSALNSISVAVGGMCLIKKAAFDKIGGYDETNVTEDRELAYRLMEAGYVIRCAESSRGYTEVPNTIKSFFNQRFRWYSGEITTICKHKKFLFNHNQDVFGLIVLPYTFIMQIVGVALVIKMLFFNFKNWLIFNYYYLLESLKYGVFNFQFSKFVYLPSTTIMGAMIICLFIIFALVSFSFSDFELKPKYYFPFFIFSSIYGAGVLGIYIYSMIRKFLGSDYRWVKS